MNAYLCSDFQCIIIFMIKICIENKMLTKTCLQKFVLMSFMEASVGYILPFFIFCFKSKQSISVDIISIHDLRQITWVNKILSKESSQWWRFIVDLRPLHAGTKKCHYRSNFHVDRTQYLTFFKVNCSVLCY